eukprot:2024503-Amphidinium_carterae.1
MNTPQVALVFKFGRTLLKVLSKCRLVELWKWSVLTFEDDLDLRYKALQGPPRHPGLPRLQYGSTNNYYGTTTQGEIMQGRSNPADIRCQNSVRSFPLELNSHTNA